MDLMKFKLPLELLSRLRSFRAQLESLHSKMSRDSATSRDLLTPTQATRRLPVLYCKIEVSILRKQIKREFIKNQSILRVKEFHPLTSRTRTSDNSCMFILSPFSHIYSTLSGLKDINNSLQSDPLSDHSK